MSECNCEDFYATNVVTDEELQLLITEAALVEKKKPMSLQIQSLIQRDVGSLWTLKLSFRERGAYDETRLVSGVYTFRGPDFSVRPKKRIRGTERLVTPRVSTSPFQDLRIEAVFQPLRSDSSESQLLVSLSATAIIDGCEQSAETTLGPTVDLYDFFGRSYRSGATIGQTSAITYQRKCCSEATSVTGGAGAKVCIRREIRRSGGAVSYGGWEFERYGCDNCKSDP